MLDLEFVIDQIDALKSKLDWAQDEIEGNIIKLRISLENFEKIKAEINELNKKVRAKLL